MMFNKKLETFGGLDRGDYSGLRPAPSSVLPKQTADALRQRPGTPARSVIDAWLTMTGNLESEGDIQVDGKVEGHIRCTQLIVGKGATINGDIVAEEVVVRGKVKGVIRANRVKLQDTACVESEIMFEQTLGIEDGASFEGQIRRTPEPSTVEARPVDGAAQGISDPAMESESTPIPSPIAA
jgi:cytoskeletal protein CcmA (bactofilin family)